MLKKLFSQRTIPWIGGFKETLSQALWWGTIINFVMLAGTFYYTTLRHVWLWFDLSKFITAVLVGAIIIYILEYKFIVPSIWAFRSKQMFEFESQLKNELGEVQKTVKRIEEKLDEQSNSNTTRTQ